MGRWVVVAGCLLTIVNLGAQVVTHAPATVWDVLLVAVSVLGLVLVIKQVNLPRERSWNLQMLCGASGRITSAGSVSGAARPNCPYSMSCVTC